MRKLLEDYQKRILAQCLSEYKQMNKPTYIVKERIESITKDLTQI